MGWNGESKALKLSRNIKNCNKRLWNKLDQGGKRLTHRKLENTAERN
jgi:hypothetical protein